MKIIPTVRKLFFFKTTDLYTLSTKTWKNILSTYESKKNSQYACKQLKNYQLRINEIGVSLEIILNAFKCLTVSLSFEMLILAIALFSFILVSILCELAMLPDVYIVLSLRKKRWTFLAEEKDIHIWRSIFIIKIEPFIYHYISMPR